MDGFRFKFQLYHWLLGKSSDSSGSQVYPSVKYGHISYFSCCDKTHDRSNFKESFTPTHLTHGFRRKLGGGDVRVQFLTV